MNEPSINLISAAEITVNFILYTFSCQVTPAVTVGHNPHTHAPHPTAATG